MLLVLQCLVLACRMQPRVTPGDVIALVDLLHHMVLRTKGALRNFSVIVPGQTAIHPLYMEVRGHVCCSVQRLSLVLRLHWLPQ